MGYKGRFDLTDGIPVNTIEEIMLFDLLNDQTTIR